MHSRLLYHTGSAGEGRTMTMETSRTAMLSTILLASLVCVIANYDFTVWFHAFHNPLGLQCGECDRGGLPACCDNAANTANCIPTPPYTCDTRFRFELRPYGAGVETAPKRGFPYYTRSYGGNSDEFREGPGGFLALPNPFTIISVQEWTGKIQFFIDALDQVATNQDDAETIINRFPIDLELMLGANFTQKQTYHGIYNISNQGFDLSFKVKCSKNFLGSKCAEFCEPTLEVYEEKAVCLLHNTTCASTSNCEISTETTVNYQDTCICTCTCSSISVIVLGVLVGVSAIVNTTLIIVIMVQRHNLKENNTHHAITDEVSSHPDQDMGNDEMMYEDNGEPISPDKLSQEAIYLGQ